MQSATGRCRYSPGCSTAGVLQDGRSCLRMLHILEISPTAPTLQRHPSASDQVRFFLMYELPLQRSHDCARRVVNYFSAIQPGFSSLCQRLRFVERRIAAMNLKRMTPCTMEIRLTRTMHTGTRADQAAVQTSKTTMLKGTRGLQEQVGVAVFMVNSYTFCAVYFGSCRPHISLV